jgi:DNA polymerase-4
MAAMTRKILHLDLDAFFCAVEELRDPSLKGKPFAVGGHADRRGVVSSCSYAARMYGVRSAMPMARALQLCPELIVVHHGFSNYSEMSKKVMKLIDITPLIEKISIDEAYLDVTGLPEPQLEIARTLQHRVNQELSLPVSIGGGTSKLVAKIANDWGKSQQKQPYPPNKITIIPPGDEANFLAPLPVQSLIGIGPKSAKKLEQVGIHTIGNLAKTPPDVLVLLFGRYGPELRERALGIDNNPIVTEHEAKSISNEVTFSKDLSDEKELVKVIRELSEEVGRRMRNEMLAGSTIQIKLRWSDFTTITRQTTLPSSTNLDQVIYDTAARLFKENWPKGKPVRLIGVGVSNLGKPAHQLGLWDDDYQKQSNLINALDELKARYGGQIIKRGGQISKPGENSQPDKS